MESFDNYNSCDYLEGSTDEDNQSIPSSFSYDEDTQSTKCEGEETDAILMTEREIEMSSKIFLPELLIPKFTSALVSKSSGLNQYNVMGRLAILPKILESNENMLFKKRSTTLPLNSSTHSQKCDATLLGPNRFSLRGEFVGASRQPSSSLNTTRQSNATSTTSVATLANIITSGQTLRLKSQSIVGTPPPPRRRRQRDMTIRPQGCSIQEDDPMFTYLLTTKDGPSSSSSSSSSLQLSNAQPLPKIREDGGFVSGLKSVVSSNSRRLSGRDLSHDDDDNFNFNMALPPLVRVGEEHLSGRFVYVHKEKSNRWL
jgi:hypothetical protein